MTAANHMLTGAVIAAAIQQPLLAIPLAMISHFPLDMIPHFGVLASNSSERNKHPFTLAVVAVDVLLVLGALILIPFAFNESVSWWVMALAMFAAWLPDLVWLAPFWHDHRGHERSKDMHWLTHFHRKIQWFEKPVGIIVELVWLVGVIALLKIMAT